MGKINIFVEGWLHPKNGIGMNLMESERISFQWNRNPGIKYDWIMNLSEFRDYDIDDETGLIFGPQIMFPSININTIPTHRKYICNVISDWVFQLSQDINPTINFTKLPFAVDSDRFRPAEKNGLPIIYFKNRDVSILNDIINNLGTNYRIFNYSDGYQENDFIDNISRAPYAIWIGTHESQGFAFQETLSCNTPIFVVNVTSLRDEMSSDSFWKTYLPENELKATSASYFDNRCGLISSRDSWVENFRIFISNLENYSPREFIIENLSPEASINRWVETLNSIRK